MPRPTNRKAYDRSRDASALSVQALDLWKPQMRAAASPLAATNATVINVYDVIGYDYWTGGGITSDWFANQISGKGDLVININSPGGDFFEGLTIHNMLRQHAGRKTINIVGLSASAASLISAAGVGEGNQVRIAPAAYVMIHNVWGLVVGNKNDMLDAARVFEKFDQGARVIYSGQTGKSDADIAALMDEETWFLGQDAVDEGFASAILPADATLEDAAEERAKALNATMSLRRMEAVLCQSMPRSKAREFLNTIRGGTQDAAPPGKQDAAVLAAAAGGLRGLLNDLKGN